MSASRVPRARRVVPNRGVCRENLASRSLEVRCQDLLILSCWTVLDEVRMSEHPEHRREPPPLQPCWRGAGSNAGGAGLICRGGSRWHCIRQKRRAILLVVFVPPYVDPSPFSHIYASFSLHFFEQFHSLTLKVFISVIRSASLRSLCFSPLAYCVLVLGVF